MTDTQPYSLHRAPAVMGLTQFEWQDFQDLIIKANDEQLEVMKIQTEKEIKKRDKIDLCSI